MSVRCPGCGRRYDDGLFALGRTIHCACGRRVRGERRSGPALPVGTRRFMVDAMLGRLARWLRIVGFDAAYEAHIADETLVRRGLEEGRTILTRDRALPEEWTVPDVHVVASERPLEQLREVLETFRLLDDVRLFTRCSRCNTLLAPAVRAEVQEVVPAGVMDTVDAFRCCPTCRRVYWSGSHVARMRRLVAQALGHAAGAGSTLAGRGSQTPARGQ